MRPMHSHPEAVTKKALHNKHSHTLVTQLHRSRKVQNCTGTDETSRGLAKVQLEIFSLGGCLALSEEALAADPHIVATPHQKPKRVRASKHIAFLVNPSSCSGLLFLVSGIRLRSGQSFSRRLPVSPPLNPHLSRANAAPPPPFPKDWNCTCFNYSRAGWTTRSVYIETLFANH